MRPRARRQWMQLYGDLHPRTFYAVGVVSLIALLGFWWFVGAINLASDDFLPSPLDVGRRAVQLARDGILWDDTSASFVRMSIGFLISTAMALPVGVLMGTFRVAAAVIEPPVDFIRYMPAVAFVPLTIIWAGIDEPQKWLVIWIGTFFAQSLMFMNNVEHVPRSFVDISRTLGMPERAILMRVVLPSAAPAIWDTLRITLGWAWTWLVLAELVAAQNGLGRRVVVAQRFFETDTIFVALIMIGLIGLLMDQAMRVAGRRLFRWAEGGH